MKQTETERKQALSNAMLNRLRAGVLGANDGIVSTASVVMGVAGATNNRGAIFTAGIAALVAGALSMAVGEYVSVSSQKDSEEEFIRNEKKHLKSNPKQQFDMLVQAYQDKGINKKLATAVATDLTKKDALKAHLDVQFNMDEDDISSPLDAAIASLLGFTAGGLIPFLAIIMASDSTRIIVTGVAVVVALLFAGYKSADVGNAPKGPAIRRVVLGGIAAMAITYAIGLLFGTSIS